MGISGDEETKGASIQLQTKIFHEKDLILDRIKQLLKYYDPAKHPLRY